jgi:hypothetical protein
MTVSYQDKIRNKLQTKAFARLGKSVTLKSKSSPLLDSRGDLISAAYTSSTITVIPYDIISDNQSQEPFGNLDVGDMAVAIPYTVTVNIDDILTIESDDWLIKELNMNYLPGNVVTIARVAKLQP